MAASAPGKFAVSDETKEALGVVLDLAYDDQDALFLQGDPATDYGSEWPEVRKSKAATFRTIAAFAESIGIHGEKERWEVLADAITGENNPCSECGTACPDGLISCPDGAEVCHTCFDGGAH